VAADTKYYSPSNLLPLQQLYSYLCLISSHNAEGPNNATAAPTHRRVQANVPAQLATESLLWKAGCC